MKGGERIKRVVLMLSVFLIAFIFCGAASAANSTTDDEVWYSTVGPSATLYAYNTTSNTTRNVTPLQDNYGDIAWGPDGSLYGVTVGGNLNSINRINTTTGGATNLKNITGFYNSMASDDLGWLYIASLDNSTFYRYNIYSSAFQQWINIEDYGIHGPVQEMLHLSTMIYMHCGLMIGHILS